MVHIFCGKSFFIIAWHTWWMPNNFTNRLRLHCFVYSQPFWLNTKIEPSILHLTLILILSFKNAIHLNFFTLTFSIPLIFSNDSRLSGKSHRNLNESHSEKKQQQIDAYVLMFLSDLRKNKQKQSFKNIILIHKSIDW